MGNLTPVSAFTTLDTEYVGAHVLADSCKSKDIADILVNRDTSHARCEAGYRPRNVASFHPASTVLSQIQRRMPLCSPNSKAMVQGSTHRIVRYPVHINNPAFTDATIDDYRKMTG